MSDDRVGLAVAEAVEKILQDQPLKGQPEASEEVDVATSTRGGFHLIDLLSGYERAIIVDCRMSPHPSPGRVSQVSVADVDGMPRLVSAHDITAAEALETARLLDIPMPRVIVVFAVEGAEISLLSEVMTPEVEAAVLPLARRIAKIARRGRPAGTALETP